MEFLRRSQRMRRRIMISWRDFIIYSLKSMYSRDSWSAPRQGVCFPSPTAFPTCCSMRTKFDPKTFKQI